MCGKILKRWGEMCRRHVLIKDHYKFSTDVKRSQKFSNLTIKGKLVGKKKQETQLTEVRAATDKLGL